LERTTSLLSIIFGIGNGEISPNELMLLFHRSGLSQQEVPDLLPANPSPPLGLAPPAHATTLLPSPPLHNSSVPSSATPQVDELMVNMDADGSGGVDFGEFIAFMAQSIETFMKEQQDGEKNEVTDSDSTQRASRLYRTLYCLFQAPAPCPNPSS
jgi:hypothetical protein